MGGDGKDGKGKGKGKGKGNGGRGGGNGKPDAQPRAWQCRSCKSNWNGKDAKFCGGCGSKRAECEFISKPDSRIQAFTDSNESMRKEMADLKKIIDQKGPIGAGGGGRGGNGKGGGNGGTNGGGNVGGKRWGGKAMGSPQPHSLPAASAAPPADSSPLEPTSSPKPVSNFDVLVNFDDTQISLGSLLELLVSNKAYFPEGHRRITEIRSAIDLGHQKRRQVTEPVQLISQTERNIKNSVIKIDKCVNRISTLKTQRQEMDSQIAGEEAKLKYEQTQLQMFKERLDEAKDRQQATAVPSGVLLNQLDGEPGMPTLRRWMQSNFSDLYIHCEQMHWKQQISRHHADLYATWAARQAAINGFATYASNRSVAETDKREVSVARQALQQMLELPHKYVEGLAARAVAEYSAGVECGGRLAIDTQCPVLLSWVKSEDTPFARAATRPGRKRMSGPYLLPENDSSENEPVVVAQYDKSTIWIDARTVILQHDAEMADSLPILGNKRSFEYVQAAELYAASVVQQKHKIMRLPRFSEYMDEVHPESGGGGSSGKGGGGEGNGSPEAKTA